jgi:predicted NUDIX family NTP pyrophosphohydrolase
MTGAVVYAGEEPPAAYARSVFLAGPSPRRAGVPSWRPDALRELAAAGYDGVTFVPERRPGGAAGFDYDAQVEWETRCLHLADVVLFWVPRDLADLPGFTTNVEWGVWQGSGKAVFGAPPDAANNDYLHRAARELRVPVADTLAGTVAAALDLLGAGAVRSGGEREVPLLVWRTPSFQQWYAAQRATGNVLQHARHVWTFWTEPARRTVFVWALRAEVWVAAEGRSKTNEFVLSRPDLAAVLLYRRAEPPGETAVVLVREFRTPVANPTGYVWELPSGSSAELTDPRAVAVAELAEETGFALPAHRLVDHGARQAVATFSAHRAHLFSAELTEAELADLRARRGQVFGVGGTERSHVEVLTLESILRDRVVDWSTLGMITSVLGGGSGPGGWRGG